MHALCVPYSIRVSVVIAEVTQPSLGVGFELGQAVALGKKTLCLFRPASGKSEQIGLFLPSIWYTHARTHARTHTHAKKITRI